MHAEPWVSVGPKHDHPWTIDTPCWCDDLHQVVEVYASVAESEDRATLYVTR